MNGLLGAIALALSFGIIYIIPGGGPAVLLCAALGALALVVIKRMPVDHGFLAQLFAAALLMRVALGTCTYLFHLQEFFGGDALTYDYLGNALLQVWRGELRYEMIGNTMAVQNFYGMPYMVATIYAIVGRNMLAVQFVNAVIGAATIVPIYLCAQQIFENRRVSRATALLIAFFPSMILWSSQGLKDAPIIFLLALAMLATLRLSRKLSIAYFVLLIGTLLGLLGLRFYIFYMVAAAVGGAFVIGMRRVTARSFVQHLIVIVGIGLAMVQFGILRRATTQYETFGNLEVLNRSRLDQMQTADSGFGKEVDVSTATGALSAIPLGLVYLLFAPFPWQVSSLRQTITLPE
ncbi:MAG TPA: glycosyltransferase family 39 protein, partial [Pyrinomonadaceae bacterium]